MASDSDATQLEFDSGGSHEAHDSSLGDVEATSTRTQSLTASVYEFRHESGRRFHSYDWRTYLLPNDENEQDRLDLQHHIFRINVDGKLHLAPIPKDVHNILDIGCGTGLWAIEMADEYPSAHVLGIDLSPIQPEYVPVNCSFRIDNVESDWVPEETYDLIHARAMISGIKDWPQLFKQAFDHLTPGGYIELHDYNLPAKIIDDFPEDKCHFIANNALIKESMRLIGINLEAPKLWREQLEAVGFTNIHCKWYNWPLGPWAKGKKNKLIGKLCWRNFYEGIETVAPLLAKTHGWDEDRKQKYITDVKAEMEEGKVHIYVQVGYWYAQRPEAPKATESAW